jgi:hypothetical protein
MYHNNIPKVRARVCSERKLGSQMSRVLPHAQPHIHVHRWRSKLPPESTSFQTTRLRARSRAYIHFSNYRLNTSPDSRTCRHLAWQWRKKFEKTNSIPRRYTSPSSIRSCSRYHQYSVHTYCRTPRTDYAAVGVETVRAYARERRCQEFVLGAEYY